MRNIALITSYNLNKAFDKFHNCSYENTANDCHRRMFELSLFKFFFFLIQFYRQPNQNQKIYEIYNFKIVFSRHKFQYIFILGSVLAIGVARALNIYPLSFLLNLGRLEYINMDY